MGKDTQNVENNAQRLIRERIKEKLLQKEESFYDDEFYGERW